MFTIKTDRLGLLPMTAKSIEAALGGSAEFEHTSQVKIPEDFVNNIYRNRVFPIRLQKITANPQLIPWYGFIVELESNTVVGTMGFKSLPNENGLVEIGYGIHHTFSGKGYATEMAKGLIRWAFKQPGVNGITATDVQKDNFASIKILEKLGMTVTNQKVTSIDFILLK